MKFEILKNDYITIKHPQSAYKIVKLYRIIALKAFGNIKAEQIGGYVEHVGNLDQTDNSWVFNEARVYDGAFVSDNSIVRDKANVFGNAKIVNSVVGGYALVHGNSVVTNCVVADKAEIKSGVVTETDVFNASKIALTSGRVYRCKLNGGAYISGNSTVEDSKLFDYCRVYDSTVRNSELRLGALVRGKNIVNETIATNIDLNIESYAE